MKITDIKYPLHYIYEVIYTHAVTIIILAEKDEMTLKIDDMVIENSDMSSY